MKLRVVAAVLVLCATPRAPASPARPLAFDDPSGAFQAAGPLGLGEVRLLDEAAAPAPTPASAREPVPLAPVPHQRLFDGRTARFTLGAAAATLLYGYATWWHEGGGHYTFTNERWFQENTYAGGADKVSHFVLSYNAEWALETAYRMLGHPDAEARWMAVAGVTALGTLIEAGDGTTFYGASWQDAVSNVAGALLSSEVSRLGLRDTVGVRFGRVKSLMPDPCCRAGLHVGSDYSREVYSLDVKLSGLLPRVGIAKAGPARFLLLSLTYGTKGYRFSWIDRWERNLGMDVGLNVPEVLRAVGVRDDSWWGAPLLGFFSVFRLPYTAIGFRYDFNHHKWSGWDTGDHFNPGSVIYD